jgi:hypothetical protein
MHTLPLALSKAVGGLSFQIKQNIPYAKGTMGWQQQFLNIEVLFSARHWTVFFQALTCLFNKTSLSFYYVVDTEGTGVS